MTRQSTRRCPFSQMRSRAGTPRWRGCTTTYFGPHPRQMDREGDVDCHQDPEIGIDRIVYGSDGAAAAILAPREAWATFRQLPLTEAEFRAIADNVAPYMR